MKLLYLLVLVGACGFSPTQVGDVQIDAHSGVSGSDAPGTIGRACHATDPSVQLCLDFEDATLEPTVVDSSRGHNGAATDVQPMTRSGQQAAAFGATSDIHIAETPDLDIADNLTFELWIESNDPHLTTWPVDNDEQYALGIANNKMFCYAAGVYANTDVDLGTQIWHHVACTYGNGTLTAYVDGVRVGCHSTNGAIPNVNTHGTDFGFGLTGGLDDIHIYSTALDDVAIARLAGVAPQQQQSNCQ
jgi:hypothetical protein